MPPSARSDSSTRSVMMPPTSTARPMVSVVTPFYNTAPYLAQCIESVLAQSYREFEYILVDNCSTDGSKDIAETYAKRDPRIRLIRCSQFVPQIPNYNRALAEICDASKYCKIVEADNYILPGCLELMVRAFEQSESIGLVSSYCLCQNTIDCSGYPYPMPFFRGRGCARWYLLTGVFIFGTPTSVMYRSCMVRENDKFYNENIAFHSDFDKCMQILLHWDFGFVHQVLSFKRRDNESITSVTDRVNYHAVARYSIVQRYAPVLLAASEAASLQKHSKREYYRALARRAFRFGDRAFWHYHAEGLKTIGETINWPYLVLTMGREFLWLALNPGMTTVKALRLWKRGATGNKDGARFGIPHLESMH
jgi:glycosyltransferase involved in cell wall biosynthesis